jgi:serine/threonine protein kinase
VQDSRVLGMRYQLLEQIGQGSMGKVYLAYDIRLKKQWAVKEVRQEAGLLFHEWDILKDLEHPSLPKVVDVWKEEDRFYFVMDYVPGWNLKEIGRTGKRISQRQIVQWGIQLAQVLVYLHGRTPPILYRDLKPSNIIVQPDHTVKLVDFSIAIRKQDDRDAVRGWGTAGYAPKEQREGKGDVRSDIYSLGAVLLYLVNHSKGTMNRRLLHCIETCMQQDVQKRYPTAQQLETKLQEILERMNRNLRLRRAGFFCIFTGCLLLEYCLYEVKEEQEKSLRMENVRSILQNKQVSVWEDLKQELSQYSVDINWENIGLLLESAEQEMLQMENSFRKADLLLTLSNCYLSYSSELEEGEKAAQEKAEELLQMGLEVSVKCPGETLRRAYEIEFLMAMSRIRDLEGKEEAQVYRRMAAEKAEEYRNTVKGWKDYEE